ncbi:MAG: hypothetical protein H3Z52_16035 [archaeon]|nr:hypothetical protein [archaeon]
MQTSYGSFLTKIQLSPSEERKRFTITFPTLLCVCTSGYWLYLKYTPLKMIVMIIEEASVHMGGELALFPRPLLRYWVMWWGEILFLSIFGLLSLYGFFLRGTRRTSLDIALLAWSILMGAFTVGVALRLVPSLGRIAIARRFHSFAYPFLFILSGYIAHQTPKGMKRIKKFRIILVAIFIAFSIFQLYSIPPYLYSDYKISYEVGESRSTLLLQEWGGILWFTRTCEMYRRIATDWEVIGKAIVIFRTDLKPEVLTEDTAVRRYDYIFIRTMGPSSLTWINRIYSNEESAIYSSI